MKNRPCREPVEVLNRAPVFECQSWMCSVAGAWEISTLEDCFLLSFMAKNFEFHLAKVAFGEVLACDSLLHIYVKPNP